MSIGSFPVNQAANELVVDVRFCLDNAFDSIERHRGGACSFHECEQKQEVGAESIGRRQSLKGHFY
ncbi:hypothetical protein [Thalassoglobus polymorphus]|uniref:hypothetical protein n=1 Tax=Thalassoglobus polymorphus TaxID=2527994 RepID=UPI0011A80DE2|nr:hypothetical protein [Thalassoglobus polymorphus]